ncbi:phage baseplate assembly protein V [Phaeobacter sp. CAU 1743]|uniref:phage baseplate assembly protein V n=1 Tax=Phaeobacter sp. CAU 1743 TaxID=3140367 RepID=UPI0023B4DAF8
MSYAAARNEQAREGIVRFGVVSAVDAGSARAKVSFGGESESGWLPWLAPRAAGISVWAPPSEGEQVIVLSESGDTAQGIIIGSAFSSANPAAGSSGAMFKIQVGPSSIEIDASGIRLNAPKIDLN